MHRLKTLAAFCKIITSIFILHSLVISGASASQIRYIRDTEVENAVRLYSKPIFEVAGLEISDVKIHLINDSRLNAFVAGGQQIFINTGTLIAAEDPTEVIGVIAHEVGHITGGHLSRLYSNIQDAQNTSLAATILGIPLAILAGRPDVAAAVIGLGQHVATRKLLSHTRANEQSADQAGVSFLDDAKISSVGMRTFFSRLQKNAQLYSKSQNPYTQTHPLTQNRIAFLDNHIQNSDLNDKKLESYFYTVHDRIRAKLIGYINGLDRTLALYPLTDTSLPALYARAIAFKENGNFDDALKHVTQLLAILPNDPFFIELKGDIYRDMGDRINAIAAYDKALEIVPWAALIHRFSARTKIETEDPKHLESALKNLTSAAQLEPNSSVVWRLLATVYGRLNDQPNLSLALAEEALLRNRMQTAIDQAQKAMNLFPRGSAKWLRAEDVLFRARDLKRKFAKS